MQTYLHSKQTHRTICPFALDIYIYIYSMLLPSPYRTFKQALQNTPVLEWHLEQSVFPAHGKSRHWLMRREAEVQFMSLYKKKKNLPKQALVTSLFPHLSQSCSPQSFFCLHMQINLAYNIAPLDHEISMLIILIKSKRISMIILFIKSIRQCEQNSNHQSEQNSSKSNLFTCKSGSKYPQLHHTRNPFLCSYNGELKL